jgi:NAD(P)-dependent dehydrogenase (short-subunit alcohol dehydrogenase family)
MELLRRGLLQGVTVAFAGVVPEAVAACAALGAATPRLQADLSDEEAVAAAVAGLGQIDTLVCATEDLDTDFIATRAAANAWIEAQREGKVVLVAPAGDEPLRAALENLARTLSVEWARYAIRPTTILPGASTSPQDVAQLIAFIASPAGDYYSGCAFSLGNAAVA